jgi:hypothetical protein
MTAPRQARDQAAARLPSPWWGLLLLAALAAGLAGIVAGAIYLWISSAPPEVRVPDVTGIKVRAAEEMLARRGLIGQITGHRYHEQAREGTIIAATPLAGRTVREGRAIELVVSDGPPWTLVPDVREMDLTRAREALSGADLRLARIERRYDDAVPAGWVLGQEPAPGGRAARREQVQLIVSAGPKQPAQSTEPLDRVRQAVVQVVLPPGESESLVRIEVQDRRGVRTAYSARHQPGSTVEQVVSGYGESIARVYVDDKLIEEKRF